MTSYDPPGQPPGPPSPPGSYGPPPAAAPGRAGSFDPKSVHPLDWGILGAGVLALIFSFFSYYSYDAKGPVKAACSQSGLPGSVSDLCSGDSAGAWNGFFGWFGVLLGLVGAALVALALFAPHVRLPFPVRLGAPAAFALGIISTLLALVVVPDWPPAAAFGVSGSDYGKGIDDGHGFSYWIVLILLVIGLALCLLRFQQTGGQLPGRYSSGASGASGATPQGYPQPGYPAPPPQYPPQPPPGYPQQ